MSPRLRIVIIFTAGMALDNLMIDGLYGWRWLMLLNFLFLILLIWQDYRKNKQANDKLFLNHNNHNKKEETW